MKINRELVIRAGLKLLNEVGLERLTLRLLGTELNVQAATIYWHFKNKEELLNELATLVLAGGTAFMTPAKMTGDWHAWAVTFGTGLRKTLLMYRDGARMVAGTRLTSTEYMQTTERIAAVLVQNGFTVRRTAFLLSTIYDYTLSLVMEEQAVYPRPGERSPEYDIAARDAKLDPKAFPILRQSGSILFGGFDRRHKAGVELIVRGAELWASDKSS